MPRLTFGSRSIVIEQGSFINHDTLVGASFTGAASGSSIWPGGMLLAEYMTRHQQVTLTHTRPSVS